MATLEQLMNASIALALLTAAGCAAGPPTQALVVPVSEAHWDIMGKAGQELAPSACQKLCAATGQPQAATRCHMTRGWDWRESYWMVCHYGDDG